MQKIVYILIAIIYYQIGYSQTEKVNPLPENCETASTKYFQLLSKYSIDQKAQIKEILSLWEKSCKDIEPILRVKILLDISENYFTDTTYSDYYKDQIFDFLDRIQAAYQDDFKDIYETNKEYFNYVPLRSEFDDWTYNIAQTLKKEQKQGTSAYVLCVLFSEDVETFDNELNSSNYQNSYIRKTMDNVVYNSSRNNVSFVARAGLWMPIGKLGWRYSMSPLIGIGANIPLTEKYSIELGANFTFWVNNKYIDVNIEDSIQSIKSKYGGTYGLWVHREHSFNNVYFIDGVAGIAYTNMGTGIEKSNTDEEDGTSFYHIGTIDLSLGLSIRKRVFKTQDAGVNLSYHFRPYNIDKRLETKLGQHSVTLSLFYMF